MEPNSINAINQIAESQAVWAVLFITLAYYFLRQATNREKLYQDHANEREKVLLKELGDMSKAMIEVSVNLKEISETQKAIISRVESVEKVLYKGETIN
mgnify:CR=1 FL=1